MTTDDGRPTDKGKFIGEVRLRPFPGHAITPKLYSHGGVHLWQWSGKEWVKIVVDHAIAKAEGK